MTVFFQAVREDRETDGRMFYVAVGPRRATFAEVLLDDGAMSNFNTFVSLYREVDGYKAEWIADLDRESGRLLAAVR